MGTFKAHVQYDDWTGSAAADDADEHDLRDLLRERNLLSEGEFLVGFEMYSGDEIAPDEQFFSAKAYIVRSSSHDLALRDALALDPIEVIVRDVPVDLPGFFRLFKRFNLMLGDRSLGLHGREYREREG